MTTLAKTSKKEIVEAAENILITDKDFQEMDFSGLPKYMQAEMIIKPACKTVWVNATVEIIKAAKPECRFCPIALAVNRVLRPSCYALMTGSLWIIPRGRKEDGFQYPETIELNSLRKIMEWYDAKGEVHPFAFELTLPCEFLL